MNAYDYAAFKAAVKAKNAAEQAAKQAQMTRMRCDGCNKGFNTDYYMCLCCDDYDLCKNCYPKRGIEKDTHKNLHDRTHKFLFYGSDSSNVDANTDTNANQMAFVPRKDRNSYERNLLSYLGQASGENRNIAYSGFSIGPVMAAIGLAAADITQKEVVALLTNQPVHEMQDVNAVAEELVKESMRLQNHLVAAGDRVLKTANAIAFGVPLDQDFRDKATSFGIKFVERSGDQSVKSLADKLVRESTKDTNGKAMIQDSGLEEGVEIKVAIINTVYFQDKFLSKFIFDKNNTNDATFTPFVGESFTVQMMNKESWFISVCTDQYKAAKIPFSTNGFNLVLVLPHKIGAEALYSLNIDEILGQKFVVVHDMIVKVPKFKLAIKEELKPFLQTCGMRTAFDGRANFSTARKENDLKIDQVKHQVVFELDEEGVTAAASTVGGMGYRGSGGCDPINKLICDRPFLAIVEYEPTKTALFVCGVQHPVYE